MWLDWVSNPGPLTYESGVLPTRDIIEKNISHARFYHVLPHINQILFAYQASVVFIN